MKKLLLSIAAVAASLALAAQAPTLSNTGSNIPPIGMKVDLAIGTGTAPSTGANQNWDFSTVSATLGATAEVITPSTSPYYSKWPNANFVTKLTVTGQGTLYGYDHITSGVWEEFATNYSGPGTGNDYTADAESVLKFPFNYGDSFTDTFTKTTGGPYTVDISYVGWGTLKTPYATYTNVAMTRQYWGPGDYKYNFYQANPLFPVAGWDPNGNKWMFVKSSTTGIEQSEVKRSLVNIYPNPSKGSFNIQLSERCESIEISNLLGQVVWKVSAPSTQSRVDLSNQPKGVYIYKLKYQEQTGQGKIVVE